MKKMKVLNRKVIYFLSLVALLISFVLIDTTDKKVLKEDDDNYEYVNSSIITNNIPVISQDEVVLKPYNSDKVEISKKYYDSNATDEEKRQSLIYYNDTFMQNSGILYKSSESFDVINIIDGTVLDIKQDELLGNVVQIKHANNLISVYEGLSTVDVKKDQMLKAGEVIGKSGKLEFEEPLENALLFEIIKDGKHVNPLDYYDKKVSEL